MSRTHVLLILSVVAVTPLNAQADEQLIREARARSNTAIATHDLDGLARIWMENVHVVTSTGSQQAGRELNRARFAAQFLDRPDVVYVRTPDTVEVFPSWEVASESGHWTGEWTQADGKTQIGGTYLAQWRKVKGEWLIQAELFVPTKCSGSSYCKKHP